MRRSRLIPRNTWTDYSYLLSASGSELDQQYQYDANGNLIQDGEHSYQYDARNRLISVDGGNTAQYLHNALGQRIKKQTGTGIDYQALAEQYNQQAQLKGSE